MRLFPSGAVPAKSAWPALPAFLRRLSPTAEVDGLDQSIYGYILHYSLREQIYLVAVTLVSFPFLYYSLELPKWIINGAISERRYWMKSNPTRAGPHMSGKLHSNSYRPMRDSAESRRGGEVRSKRRLAMSGGGGARWS